MTLQEKYEKQKEINKELVDENEAFKFAARMSEKTEKQLRKENAELIKKIGIYQKGMYDEIEKRDKKLTKAKELLKQWQQADICDSVVLFADTEQFLKEFEK